MHWSGKLYLWFGFVLLIPALLLSAKLLQIRNHWLAEVEKGQQNYQAGWDRLQTAEKALTLAEEEYNQLVRSWGEIVTGQGGPTQAATGVAYALGLNSDPGIQMPATADAAAPLVYIFADAEGQPTKYIGQFAVNLVNANALGAALTRNPYDNEVQGWQPGNLHIRKSIPGNWLATTEQLHKQILIAKADLADQQLQLKNVQDQIRASQATLEQRMSELNGDATASDDIAKNGLVESFRKFETRRNELLATTDALRRQVDATYVDLTKTLEANAERVKQLERAVPSSNENPAPESGPQANLVPARSAGVLN